MSQVAAKPLASATTMASTCEPRRASSTALCALPALAVGMPEVDVPGGDGTAAEADRTGAGASGSAFGERGNSAPFKTPATGAALGSLVVSESFSVGSLDASAACSP